MATNSGTVTQGAPAQTSPRGGVTELAITGMTCGNCARHVTEAIQSVPGVRSATVNLEANRATVRWAQEADPDLATLLNAVITEGYGASVAAEPTPEEKPGLLSGWQLNLTLGLPALVVLMIGEWGLGFGMQPWFQWLAFAFATVVQVFAGARFYRGAWSQLKAGSSNMDTLVALGSTTAYGYSTWALLAAQGGHVYFMESTAIITLISLGHWMESRVSARASSALRQLLNLAPAMARRRNPDQSETEVPVANLSPGDIVALQPGDAIPTDGEVIEGFSLVNESMLTGESAPVEKTPKTQLYAGTSNMNGRLLMRVGAIGEGTALSHIIAAVQRAQSSRANIQRLGDRVSSVFVPVVVTIAVGAALWWGLAPDSANAVHAWAAPFLWTAHPPQGSIAAAAIIAAAVLIVACPCAMGLATPAAIMAGSNAAAKRGILIRDGVALEKAGKVTAVLFDKTGTLTFGKPAVEKTWDPPNHPTNTPLLPLAAALARHSSHPISQAVSQVSPATLLVERWEEVCGSGIQANLPSVDAAPQPIARLGSIAWLRETGVDLTPGDAFISEWSKQGATLVGVSMDRQLLGLFAIKDTLKPGAQNVISRLHATGLKTYLVTGDNQLTAASIAQQAGIAPENVFAEVRPAKKAELVRQLQKQGEKVAFVGDGINDAPALEQSDLGIAVSRASDIAREAADIILLKTEIEAVPECIGLARATLRTIKQNLFWAFFYNAVGVPLAALGFMSPILCAAAMGLSDLIVIGNALRLRSWRE